MFDRRTRLAEPRLAKITSELIHQQAISLHRQPIELVLAELTYEVCDSSIETFFSAEGPQSARDVQSKTRRCRIGDQDGRVMCSGDRTPAWSRSAAPVKFNLHNHCNLKIIV